MSSSSMNPDQWRQLNLQFEAWLDCEPSGRNELLRGFAQEHPDIQDELKKLIANFEKAKPFLEPDDQPTQIGPYRILRELGAGGMGLVYLAQRSDGQFHQEVALKVVRQANVFPSLVEKFMRERQILAHLNHPGIARLLDGGTTEEGVLFYTMEYVEGQHLLEYAQAKRLDLRARVRLIMDVCRAVQAAHRNLVVHRDLKPSNIMVTEAGEVKLLDFGIAKLLEKGAGGPETMIMTPRYCSPEQVLGEPISTVSDIFSIGLILVELLTESHPYEAYVSNFELQQAIVQKAVTQPSKTLVKKPIAPYSWKDVRGDLDAVCQKALAINPAERYQSADALAQDLQNWMENKPVHARPQSWFQLGSKWVLRHKAIAALGWLLLVSWGVGSLGIWRQNQAIRAESQRVRFERDRALQISQFLEDIFEQADPELTLGDMPDALTILENGRQQLETGLKGQPQQRAVLSHALAKVYFKLGLSEDARQIGEKALAALEAGPMAAEHRFLLAQIHLDLGNFDAAMDFAEQARAMFVASGEQAFLALSLNTLGDCQSKLGLPDRAEAYYQQAWEIEKNHELEPKQRLAILTSQANHYSELDANQKALASFEKIFQLKADIFPPAHPSLGITHIHLANTLRKNMRLEEAEQHFRLGLDILNRVYPDGHSLLATTHNDFAGLLRQQGKFDEAGDHYQRSNELLLKLYGEDHPHTLMGRSNYGVFLAFVSQDFAGAVTQFEWAREKADKVLPADHQFHAQVRNNLAVAYERLGNYRRAGDYFRECVAHYRRVSQTVPHPKLAFALCELGNFLVRQGDYSAAEKCTLEALTLLETNAGQNAIDLIYGLQCHGQALTQLGKLKESEAMLTRSAALLDAYPDLKWEGANQARLIAELQAKQGKWREVRTLLLQELPQIEKYLGPTHPNTRRAKALLEEALTKE